QKWGEILWRGSTVLSTGEMVLLQPMTWVDMPEFQCLEEREHHSGQFRTPCAAGAVVVFPTTHGITNCLFRRVIVHGDLRIIHKNGEAVPVIVQTGQRLALCRVQLGRCVIG